MPVDKESEIDDTSGMNSDSDRAVSHSRLADDAMQRDFPDTFPSREAWDEYNDRLDREERSAEHRALHGSEVKYPETVVLHAKDGCVACGGKGYVTESHGEDLDCDCCFENATPEQVESVEMGAFMILPAKGYTKMMEGAN